MYMGEAQDDLSGVDPLQAYHFKETRQHLDNFIPQWPLQTRKQVQASYQVYWDELFIKLKVPERPKLDVRPSRACDQHHDVPFGWSHVKPLRQDMCFTCITLSLTGCRRRGYVHLRLVCFSHIKRMVTNVPVEVSTMALSIHLPPQRVALVVGKKTGQPKSWIRLANTTFVLSLRAWSWL